MPPPAPNADPTFAAAFFQSLADPTRLRCLALMVRAGELCVCDITAVLGESQPKISRHLAFLRRAGMVCDRRNGQWVHYRIDPDLPPWAWQVLQATAAGLAAQPPFAADSQGLARRRNGQTAAA